MLTYKRKTLSSFKIKTIKETKKTSYIKPSHSQNFTK